jgi:DNA-binding transcriptional LysR family regulator
MELRHLRYFVAVAEAENVSRAALKLHVSQPAVSRQIRDLEEELGFALFERGAQSVRLTEAGRALLAEGRGVLDRLEEAVRVARAAATGGGAEVEIGYAPSPTVRILPPALRAFRAESPGVRVKLRDLSTEEMLAGIREGRLQIAFLVRPTRAMLRGLTFAELARDPLCVAVAPAHPFARLRSVTPAQVAREPLLALTRKDYPEYHECLDSIFAGLPRRPRIAEEHDSGPSLVAAIEAGSGVAVAPESLACTAGPRLKLVRLSPAPEPLVIGAVWRTGRLGGAAGQFLKAAREAAAKIGTPPGRGQGSGDQAGC